jgi:hypothetical protein
MLDYSKNLLAFAAATILISSTLVPVGFLQKAEAATINITTDTTWTNMVIGAADFVNISQHATLTITGGVVNSGTINVNSGSILFISQGAEMNINSGGDLNLFQDPDDQFLTELDVFGTLTIKSGGILNVNSATLLVGNGGTINVFGDLVVPDRVIEGNGTVIVNSGGTLNVESGGDLLLAGILNLSGNLAIKNGGEFTIFNDRGTLNVNSGGVLSVLGTLRMDSSIDVDLGTINVNSGGILNINSLGILGAVGTVNVFGTINVNSGGELTVFGDQGTLTIKSGGILNLNSGGILHVSIEGILNVFGTLTIKSGGILNLNSGGILNNETGGILNIYGTLLIKNGGILTNAGTINKRCGGIFTIEVGGDFVGNPIKDLCASFPITHMSDTTASSGSKIFKGGNTIIGERVTSTSQLKGDKIDQITIKLRKFGTPTGNAIVGIFSSTGVLKKQFAAKDVATLTTGFKDYTFKLSGGALYTIVSGDRIGIKYASGSSINSISVMRDTNPADPFDGTKTDVQQFKAGVWSGINTNDMYMILKQTHA